MTYSTFSLRRISCLLLAILLMLCHVPFSALANEVQPPFVFALTWMEGETPMEALSSEVTEPGYEGSYWLYVPANALAADAALEIRDTYAQYASFSPASGTPLSQLMFADAADLGGEYLEITGFDANNQPVCFHANGYARRARARAGHSLCARILCGSKRQYHADFLCHRLHGR